MAGASSLQDRKLAQQSGVRATAPPLRTLDPRNRSRRDQRRATDARSARTGGTAVPDDFGARSSRCNTIGDSQGFDFHNAIVGMLPRLWRFAFVLTGNRPDADDE